MYTNKAKHTGPLAAVKFKSIKFGKIKGKSNISNNLFLGGEKPEYFALDVTNFLSEFVRETFLSRQRNLP